VTGESEGGEPGAGEGAARERYTQYPRPVLWLVPEGEPAAPGGALAIAPFYLSTLPVTNLQLEAFTGERARAAAAPGDDDPAVGVGFPLAEDYCRWYARVSKKAIRLPSEAEWEHACRAGTSGRWFWGERAEEADAWAWHRGNSGERVPSLAAKRTNGFGLHAMLGGVWEWVVGDEGPVLRGGSWRTPLSELGCGERRIDPPAELIAEAGFRIARSLRG
jgi:formylglycine-generating enzyme required for sulfatase activity